MMISLIIIALILFLLARVYKLWLEKVAKITAQSSMALFDQHVTEHLIYDMLRRTPLLQLISELWQSLYITVYMTVYGVPHDIKHIQFLWLRHTCTAVTYSETGHNPLIYNPHKKEWYRNVYAFILAPDQKSAQLALPSTVTSFDCSHTVMTELDDMPIQTESITCSYTNILQLDHLPIHLTYLVCKSTLITSLDNLPPTLAELDCASCEYLTQLDNLPPNLTYLCCVLTNVTTLNKLPTSLTYLDCSNCRSLTQINNLPSNLTHLYCSSTGISTLDNIPPLITNIDCLHTKILQLNIRHLPCLKSLSCSTADIDMLPISLRDLTFSRVVRKFSPIIIPPFSKLQTVDGYFHEKANQHIKKTNATYRMQKRHTVTQVLKACPVHISHKKMLFQMFLGGTL